MIDGQTSGAICINGESTVMNFMHTTTEESYEVVYVISNTDDEIISVSDEPFYDFLDQQAGDCKLYAFVFQGSLDEASTEAGLSVSGISADVCGELTSEYVSIQKLECNTEGGCSDLYISEYLEGTSQNKAIEIYNPTPFDINLSEYTVSTYNNGATTPTNQQVLSGTLVSGDVYVVSHSDASALILAEADETSGISWYNGNDVIALYHNNVLIDILGVIGEDPGESTPWDVNGVQYAMAEHTLVRSPLVNSGETDWAVGQTQWEVYPQNTFDYIGSHTAIPCNFDETPTISFSNSSLTTQEGNTVNVNVTVAFPISEVEAEITIVGGDADPLLDFTNVFPASIIFQEGEFTPQTVQVMITDDMLPEGAETIDLELTTTTDGVQIGIAFLTITIL
ncbi:MAG: lamin tail domain-containing protein, partial [Flavobacteriales bacterium]